MSDEKEQELDLDDIIAESTAPDDNEAPDNEPDTEPDSEPDNEPSVDPTIEAEARKYGWRPQEEWRGDKSGWVPPERFLELPSTHVKQLRDELRAKEQDFQKRIEGLERGNKAAMEAQKKFYEDKVDRLKAERRAAADAGDMEAFDRLDKQVSEVEQQARTETTEPQKEEGPKPHPDVAAYRESDDGKWLSNPLLVAEGKQLIDGSYVAQQMAPMDQVKWAEQQLRQRYPGMFEQPKQEQQRHAKVDEGGLAPSRGGKSLAGKLPSEAKAQGKEFIEMGLFKNLEEYAKDYFGETA